VDEGKPGAASLGPAVGLLHDLHEARTGPSVPALLERLYERTRVMAALTGTRRGEAQIANLEKVATLARQAADLGVLTLRGFTTLLAERIESAGEEPDLPTTRPGDPATVRILSIHKAKGLEAPIVCLYDTADNAGARPDTVALWEEGTIAIGFRGGCQPPDWDALVKKEEARARAEMRRLLYVACTRARDWLVIPKPPGDARVGDFWKELSSRLPAASDLDVRIVDADTLPAPETGEARPEFFVVEGDGGDLVAARWEKARRETLAGAAERPFTPAAATSVAGREAPPAVGAPSPQGRAFGGLVHRVLEWLPFDAPREAALAMAEALAPSFGLDAEAGRRAGEHAARALTLPVLERARRSPRVRRELPLFFPDGADLVEGVVDLVFEEDGQLVVVDYKTDQIEPGQAFAQAAHHAPQLQLYGRGLAQATGQSIKERLVLFTTLGQVVPV
jgi:ATP-dependent helicase/nuclease subunit A